MMMMAKYVRQFNIGLTWFSHLVLPFSLNSHLSCCCMSSYNVTQEASWVSFDFSSLCLLSFCLWLPLLTFCFVPSVSKHRDMCISGAVFSLNLSLWADVLPPTLLTLIQTFHAHNLPSWLKVTRSHLYLPER